MTIGTAAIRRNGTPRAKPSQIRCAVYCRISVDDSRELDFRSTDAQREAIEAYIQGQRDAGWVALPEAFVDTGCSGGTIQRPAFQRLLAQAEAGAIERIVVHRLDRFSRSLLDFARVMDTLERQGVGLVSVTQQFDTSTPMGRLTLNMLLSFAQFEREMIADRTRDKMAAAKRKGKWVGGCVVLGYDLASGGGAIVVNEAEAERVRSIFRLYLDIGTLSETVAELKRRDWRNKRSISQRGKIRGGGPITKSSLCHMLRNVLYRGKLTFHDEVHEGEHEPIVDQPLWDDVQAALSRNGTGAAAAKRNKHGALLKGILRCACGAAMTPTSSRRGNRLYRYYTCVRAQKEGRAACPTRSLAAGDIEALVVEHIRAIGRDRTVVAEAVAAAKSHLTEERRRLQNDLRLVDQELRQLRDGQASPGATDALKARGEALRQQIEALESQRIDEAQLRAALAEFDAVWRALQPREQIRLVHVLVARVVVDGRTDDVEITFKPTGISALEKEPG